MSEDQLVSIKGNNFDTDAIDIVSINDTPLVFYTLKKNNGRLSHHFRFGVYRYDRRKIKPSGSAYFYCVVDGCKSSVKAHYVDEESEPSEMEILNPHHNHLPNVASQYMFWNRFQGRCVQNALIHFRTSEI